jgi:hypothetical protein
MDACFFQVLLTFSPVTGVVPPSLSDRIKQALADYGIIALILLAIGAYIALNDKLLELNRSLGRVEGQLQILQQQKLPATTP